MARRCEGREGGREGGRRRRGIDNESFYEIKRRGNAKSDYFDGATKSEILFLVLLLLLC